MKFYHIAHVLDYKGGELSTTLNLDKKELIAFFADLLYEYMYESIELDISFDDLLKEVNDAFDDSDFTSIYAGGGTRFCGEVYATKVGSGFTHLVNWKSSKWVERYTKKLFKYLKSDLEEYNE